MDVEAQNNILDSLLGAGQGSPMPPTLRMELRVGDPRITGSVEIDYAGYAAVEISTSTSWSTAAADGVKERDSVVTFPAPTGEATNPATHWAAYDPDTNALYFVGLLSERLNITGAGDGPTVRPRVRVADALTNAA